jgi:hypothetical protein
LYLYLVSYETTIAAIAAAAAAAAAAVVVVVVVALAPDMCVRHSVIYIRPNS